MKTRLAFSTCLLAFGLKMAAADLSRSTFTQVVNDVSILDAKTQGAIRAKLNDVLQAPDRVRTGPQSRAELRAPDDTITRVGANTVFSFDSAGRSMNLEKGSLLFHSPTGKGGGTVKTGRASAAVLGTTIVLVATADGGFKGIVLEGRGQFTLASGASRKLNAGQAVYVLPGNKSFSPTLDINLSKLVSESGLVKAYAAPLASLPKVNAAITVQDQKIEKGTLQDTGLIAGNTATEKTVTVVDSVTFTAALRENQGAVEKSWKRDLKIEDPQIPWERMFSRGEKHYPKDSVWSSAINYAVLGQDIDLDAENILLPKLNGLGPYQPATFGVVADETLTIKQSIDFHPATSGQGQTAPQPRLVLAGDEIKIEENAHVRYHGAADLVVVSDDTLKLQGNTLESVGGNLKVHSQQGSVEISASELKAKPTGDVDVLSRKGTLRITSSALTGQTFSLAADNTLELRNTSFRTPVVGGQTAQLAISAETVVLANVALPEGQVSLKSREGALAPNPNTRRAVMNGYVNFVENVTYRSERAERYVLGQGDLGSDIVISKR